MASRGLQQLGRRVLTLPRTGSSLGVRPVLIPGCRSHASVVGTIEEEPKREHRFGLLKVFVTVMTGLSIGALVSQKMAAFLEENELFVPEDDDDDDD